MNYVKTITTLCCIRFYWSSWFVVLGKWFLELQRWILLFYCIFTFQTQSLPNQPSKGFSGQFYYEVLLIFYLCDFILGINNCVINLQIAETVGLRSRKLKFANFLSKSTCHLCIFVQSNIFLSLWYLYHRNFGHNYLRFAIFTFRN